jgi:FkbM family methyltransferase
MAPTRTKQIVLGASRRLGLEGQLRTVQRLAMNRTERRDLRDNEHLRVLLAATLRPDSNCIDVGANVGDVLREIVRCAPSGSHMAVEPLPEHCDRLREQFPGVSIQHAAMGARAGTATFYRMLPAPAQSSLNTLGRALSEMEPFSVNVVSLDQIAEPIKPVRLIKIDVEGAELGVLQGAQETLSRDRPVVVLEHGAAAKHFGTRPEDIFAFASEVGMRIFDIDGGGPHSQSDFAAIANGGSYWTWILQ